MVLAWGWFICLFTNLRKKRQPNWVSTESKEYVTINTPNERSCQKKYKGNYVGGTIYYPLHHHHAVFGIYIIEPWLLHWILKYKWNCGRLYVEKFTGHHGFNLMSFLKKKMTGYITVMKSLVGYGVSFETLALDNSYLGCPSRPVEV